MLAADAADALGLSVRHIQRLCAQGKLKATWKRLDIKFVGVPMRRWCWEIDGASVLALKARRDE